MTITPEENMSDLPGERDIKGDYVFLNTGISELNAMLTRDERFGIALPSEGGISSSITVVKGPTGKGKSAICAILAQKLHLNKSAAVSVLPVTGKRSVKKDSHPYLPFCIYFSFSQPSQSLYHYIDELLPKKEKNTGSNGKKYSACPLIVSPCKPLSFYETDGLAVLRRFLLESISGLLQQPFSDNDKDSSVEKLVPLVQGFMNSGVWKCGKGMDDIIPIKFFKGDSTYRIVPIIFLDSINYFFHFQDSRQVVAELFAAFRTLQIPLFVILEDADPMDHLSERNLIRHLEFEADVIVELGERGQSHKRNLIEIRKNRNSQPIHGQHLCRIEKPRHSLTNIPSKWKDNHPGILIFKSIHWFISTSRGRYESKKRYSSGIIDFDKVLCEGNSEGSNDALFPADAFILVRGHKGGHKLALGFNLLLGGIAHPRLQEQNIPKSESVLFVSLGEETSVNIPRIALTKNKNDMLFNLERRAIVEDQQNASVNGNLINDSVTQQVDAKVMINEWRVTSASSTLEGSAVANNKKSLVELCFKPGHLSQEEFLWIIESVCNEFMPARILVENTAHLRMRFPELYAETMLFPALSNFTHSKNIMLIVTDVMGDGSDEQLSYGLMACADYIADVNLLKDKGAIDPYAEKLSKENGRAITDKGLLWSELLFSNIRGKNYIRFPRGITVLMENIESCQRNVLEIVNLEENSTAVAGCKSD